MPITKKNLHKRKTASSSVFILVPLLFLFTQSCVGKPIHELSEETWLQLLRLREELPLKEGEAIDFDSLSRLGTGASLFVALRAMEQGSLGVAKAALNDSLAREQGFFKARAVSHLADVLLEKKDGESLLAFCRSGHGAALEPFRRAWLELKALLLLKDYGGLLNSIEKTRDSFPLESEKAAAEIAAMAAEAGLATNGGRWIQEFYSLLAMPASNAVYQNLERLVETIAALEYGDFIKALEAIGPEAFVLAEARALAGSKNYGPAVLAFRSYANASEDASSISARYKITPLAEKEETEEKDKDGFLLTRLGQNPPSPPLPPKTMGQLLLRLERGIASDVARAFLVSSRSEGKQGLLWIMETKQDRGPDIQKEYFAHFWHGRYLREEGQWKAALEAFQKAAGLAGHGADRDAALWYLVEAAWKSDPKSAHQVFLKEIQQASNPADFSDLLEPIVRDALARKDGTALLALACQGEGKLSKADSAKLNYLCARSIQAGIVADEHLSVFLGGDYASKESLIEELFRKAHDQNADPWYHTLAAYRLGLALVDPLHEDESKTAIETKADKKEKDTPKAYAEALVHFGMANLLRRELGSHFGKLDSSVVRAGSLSLYEQGFPEEAYRLIATQFWKTGFLPSRADAELYWPRPYPELFLANSSRNKMDIFLLYALARAESAFNKDALSRSGAIGLLQLMPATAAEMADRLKTSDYDLKNPDHNLMLGSYYFQRLMDGQTAKNRVLAALCSYNAGPTRFRGWEQSYGPLPMDLLLDTLDYAETRQYGRNVILAALNYAALYGEENLQDYFSWLLGETAR